MVVHQNFTVTNSVTCGDVCQNPRLYYTNPHTHSTYLTSYIYTLLLHQPPHALYISTAVHLTSYTLLLRQPPHALYILHLTRCYYTTPHTHSTRRRDSAGRRAAPRSPSESDRGAARSWTLATHPATSTHVTHAAAAAAHHSIAVRGRGGALRAHPPLSPHRTSVTSVTSVTSAPLATPHVRYIRYVRYIRPSRHTARPRARESCAASRPLRP